MLKDVTLEKLEKYGLKLPVSQKTVWKWMVKAGGVNGTYEKHCYNDKHQDAETIAYRNRYIQILKKLERRMLMWVQISEAEELRLQELKPDTWIAGVLLPSGKYLHHQDDWDAFIDMPKRTHPDGGVGPKPAESEWQCDWAHTYLSCKCHLLLNHHGKDESIYKAFQLTSRIWTMEGVRGLRKKGDGPGEMVSAYTDDFLGFGLALSVSVFCFSTHGGRINTARTQLL